MRRLFLLLAAAALVSEACDSPTAPAKEKVVIEYPKCHSVNFGWEHKEGSPFFVTTVWEDWVCDDGHSWRVYSDERGVVPLEPGVL